MIEYGRKQTDRSFIESMILTDSDNYGVRRWANECGIATGYADKDGGLIRLYGSAEWTKEYFTSVIDR